MSKDEEVRNVFVRRRNLLYLIHRQLQDSGYHNVAELLKSEARLSDEYELCDNIDLDSVYLEYASYFHLRFGKYPKILRKVQQPVKIELTARQKTKKSPSQAPATPQIAPMNSLPAKNSNSNPTTTTMTTTTGTTPTTLMGNGIAIGMGGGMSNEKPPVEPAGLQITVQKIDIGGGCSNEYDQKRAGLELLQEIEHCNPSGADHLLGSQDWQLLADLMKTTILRDEVKLSWADVCGNVQAIEIIKEAVLAPINYPQLFVHGLKPWKSVLLHGLPGSGKTLLAKVLYAETRKQVTFFHITSSVIISKWRGESEKLIRILFHLAHKHAPSIIFFDEIESLTSKRDRGTDHEASKRFKNEFLQLLDGMEQRNDGVFLLATTNLPWDIDEAFLRRFEKKLLVQLPNAVERSRLIHRLLPLTIGVNKEQMANLVRLSEHFTGDEIRLACKDIAMEVVRRATHGKSTEELQIEKAFEKIKPLSRKLMSKYEQWQQEHGS